jgi:hypothetical protein
MNNHPANLRQGCVLAIAQVWNWRSLPHADCTNTGQCSGEAPENGADAVVLFQLLTEDLEGPTRHIVRMIGQQADSEERSLRIGTVSLDGRRFPPGEITFKIATGHPEVSLLERFSCHRKEYRDGEIIQYFIQFAQAVCSPRRVIQWVE